MRISLLSLIYIVFTISISAYTQELRYDSMKLKEKTVFLKDEKNGNQFKYYENGNVESIKRWKKDKKENTLISFHMNGVIKLKQSFIKNKKEGLTTAYNKKGQKIFEALYQHDKIIKAYIYQSGKKVKLTVSQMKKLKRNMND